MQVDSVRARMERDGSVITVMPLIGDSVTRLATPRDKVLALLSQADASGKITWELQDAEKVREGKCSAVFDGVLEGTEWKFRLETYTTTRVTLVVEIGDDQVYPCGEELLDRLYLRLCETYGVNRPSRIFVAPHIKEEMAQEERLLGKLLATFNSM